VIEDEHIKARKAFVQMEHPKAGTLTLVAPWVRLSRTPSEVRTVSPLLAQHTDEVLRGVLGMADQEISALREQGVVG
jgi:crotonobetainyl-CoA:carnitine CoA-transferase CaiB-like acyl-CoA transferase